MAYFFSVFYSAFSRVIALSTLSTFMVNYPFEVPSPPPPPPPPISPMSSGCTHLPVSAAVDGRAEKSFEHTGVHPSPNRRRKGWTCDLSQLADIFTGPCCRVFLAAGQREYSVTPPSAYHRMLSTVSISSLPTCQRYILFTLCGFYNRRVCTV